MLVLSRKKGQYLVLDLGDGRQVNIQMLGKSGRAFSVGVEAPKSVGITRGELLDRAEPSPIGDTPAAAETLLAFSAGGGT